MKRLEAIVFDWAGTTVDFGSLAPVRAVTEMFRREGIRISDADVRRDMGLYKKDHIRGILRMSHVEGAWRERHGRSPDQRDVERMFEQFIPLQMEVLEQYAQLILSVGRVTETLKEKGLKIGSTTGYTRPMLEVLQRAAKEQGYHPDLALCPDDVGGGRPLPWMCLQIAREFRLKAMAAAVKVGDTISDIEEGLHAGMWTVGVMATGNEIGLSPIEYAALDLYERNRLLEQARDRLRAAGAHYVVDSVALIEPIIEALDERAASGERP